MIDPLQPWSALDELTGAYEVAATQLENDCTYGPDVPFDEYRSTEWQSEPDAQPVTQTYHTHLTQRGDAVVFELGEGIVLARWSTEAGRLTEVERIGAEGVTFYLEGFGVGPVSEADERLLIAGESEWVFQDQHWVPGEVCVGRTAWEMLRISERPEPDARDLHFALRWPADSPADLDLMVRQPPIDSGSTLPFSHFAEVNSSCYQLRAAGSAVAEEAGGEPIGGPASGFVAPLSATERSYHEEVIRCSYARYGVWDIGVANWSRLEDVDFEIEIFTGATLTAEKSRERNSVALVGSAPPLTMARMAFELPAPTSVNTLGSVTFLVVGSLRDPAERPLDPVTSTPLGFNKAAYEGFGYAEFLAALGLDDSS